MNKIYKELQEAFKSIEDKNNGVPGNMPIVATGIPMIDIYRIANSLLLEALSDKEEKVCPFPQGNELCTDGINTYHQFNTTEPGYMCGYCKKKAPKRKEKKYPPIEELLKKGYIGGELEHEIYKPEQKFCGGEPCICEPMVQEPKQSTSLKEDQLPSIRTLKEEVYDSLLKMVKSDRYRNTASTLEMTEEILKLIQSHLVKEIKGKSFYGPDLEDMFWEKDIIKIINNISK